MKHYLGKINLALCFIALSSMSITEVAMASDPAPVPIAGALGPIGLVVAGVGYGGYKLIKHMRNRD